MKHSVLDFSSCKTPKDVLSTFESTLAIPECDEELGVVWHSLMSKTDGDICLEVCGLYSLPPELDEYRRRIIEVIDDIDEISPNITFTIIS